MGTNHILMVTLKFLEQYNHRLSLSILTLTGHHLLALKSESGLNHLPPPGPKCYQAVCIIYSISGRGNTLLHMPWHISQPYARR